MPSRFITVVETRSFIAAAGACMTDIERTAAIGMIAEDPGCGVLVRGGGGIRKVRFAVGGRGKSGGVRIVYYFHCERVPVFLLTVFAKNEKSDLSGTELRQLSSLAKGLAQRYGG